MLAEWRLSLLMLIGSALLLKVEASAPTWTTQRKLSFREKTRDLWNYAFDNYMAHAYPKDELRPLSCIGRGPEYGKSDDWVINDVVGNFSLTLVDALDSFIVMNDRRGFAQAVQNVIAAVPSFDLDHRPQVFEVNIRVLGGLLSAHQFASDTKRKFFLKWYKGQLLELALDLGQRLLPAFKTPTGIPYARVNLRHGVLAGESFETCTAGAGSLIVEFGILSRLTGDPRFENAAHKAFFAIWNRRSDIGLVGNTINAWTGAWLSPEVSGIGAGIDSFFEYALKWYILTGEVEFYDVFTEAYTAIMRYSRGPEGYWFSQVNMKTGDVAYASTDSLSSFWSGLQVLAGDVENAVKSHLVYFNLWRRFSGIPEVFDLNLRLPSAWSYPLRPEFVESTYFLYRATRDTFYLDIGERVLSDLVTRAKVDCGLAGVENLLTNKRSDRMESFVLSETLKYLYLLFDEENLLHHDDSNMVFTTEGHMVMLPHEYIKPVSAVRRRLRRVENLQCPAYEPLRLPWDPSDHLYGLQTSIRGREDTEFARFSVGAEDNSRAVAEDSRYWFEAGWCEVPRVDLYSYNFVMSSDGRTAKEDFSPDRNKLVEVDNGYVLQNISGIRTHITRRLDGRGYDITKLGPFAVRTGQKVFINDSSINYGVDDSATTDRQESVTLSLRLDFVDPMLQQQLGSDFIEREANVTAYTSFFAGDPTAPPVQGREPLRFNRSPLPIAVIAENRLGCDAYRSGSVRRDAVLVVERGDCTFLQKLQMAKLAGAAGVLLANSDDEDLHPTADAEEIREGPVDVDDVVMVVVGRTGMKVVHEMLEFGASREDYQPDVLLSVAHERANPQTHQEKDTHEDHPLRTKHLYIGGHPVINAELLT